jgi:hypothetical protein
LTDDPFAGSAGQQGSGDDMDPQNASNSATCSSTRAAIKLNLEIQISDIIFEGLGSASRDDIIALNHQVQEWLADEAMEERIEEVRVLAYNSVRYSNTFSSLKACSTTLKHSAADAKSSFAMSNRVVSHFESIINVIIIAIDIPYLEHQISCLLSCMVRDKLILMKVKVMLYENSKPLSIYSFLWGCLNLVLQYANLLLLVLELMLNENNSLF